MESINQCSCKPNKLHWFVLLCGYIILSAAIIYLYWVNTTNIEHLRAKFINLNQKYLFTHNALNKQGLELQRFNTILPKDLTTDKVWALAEFKFLVHSAKDSLEVYQNPSLALNKLQQAKQILTILKNHDQSSQIEKLLDSKIAELQSLSAIDLNTIKLTLNSTYQNTVNLGKNFMYNFIHTKNLTTIADEPTPNAQVEHTSSTWRAFFTKLWQQSKNFFVKSIKIRNYESGILPNTVYLEDNFIAILDACLSLEQARFALAIQNHDMYYDALNQAKNKLTTCSNVPQTELNIILNNLNTLLNTQAFVEKNTLLKDFDKLEQLN